MAEPLLILALLLQAAPPDHFHYALGGLMSGPLVIDIDLVTGNASISDPPARPDKPTPPPHAQTLSPQEIASLKSEIRRALKAGLKSADCRRQEARGQIFMPIMDALPVMAVTLDGTTSSAPAAINCWSKAADRLLAAAYAVTHPQ